MDLPNTDGVALPTTPLTLPPRSGPIDVVPPVSHEPQTLRKESSNWMDLASRAANTPC